MDCPLSSNTSFDDLPDILVLDILLRLPVKTLIQSTWVCKLWYSIIKTPSFVSSHLTRSISDPSGYYIYLFRNYSPSITVISDNHLLTRHPNFVLPFEIEYASAYISTCNGLVCATSDSHDIYLINPIIHKHKKLEFESSCLFDWIYEPPHQNLVGINVGFGYSEVQNDYKVVRIFHFGPYRHRISDSVYEPCVLESEAEIYSLKSGKWEYLYVSIELLSDSSPVFVDGCLYWSAYQSSGPDKYLVCFDLKDEVFSRIEFPATYLQLDPTLGRNILIKNGSVAVVVYNNDLNSISPCMRIYIFVLEKNVVGGQVQWKELYYECGANFNVEKCIGFSGVGRLLFAERNRRFETEYIVAVDLDNSCAIEKLVVDDSTDIADGVTNVLESLVLLLD